jgi:uncharacterized protein YhhL (DUF1145 family)
MTDPTPPALAKPASPSLLSSMAAAKHHFAVFGVVILVALIYQFGYPLLISLALLATFAALAMLVGLTALDLIASSKARPAPRAAKVSAAAAQAA